MKDVELLVHLRIESDGGENLRQIILQTDDLMMMTFSWPFRTVISLSC